MFQNEINWDETVTTVIDDFDDFEDVKLYIDENAVYIRQWKNDKIQGYDLIIMTNKMFAEMQEALQHTEGLYITK